MVLPKLRNVNGKMLNTTKVIVDESKFKTCSVNENLVCTEQVDKQRGQTKVINRCGGINYKKVHTKRAAVIGD